MKTLTKIFLKHTLYGCFKIVNIKEPVLKFY